MSEATIKAVITETLEGVTGIGVVHGRRRYSRSLAAYLELMRAGGIVNGCFVHRAACPAQPTDWPYITRSHRFILSFIYELDDAGNSSDDFQALLDAVFDAFKSDLQLGGTCLDSDPVQFDDIDEMEIGEKIYHTADLALVCRERVTYR